MNSNARIYIIPKINKLLDIIIPKLSQFADMPNIGAKY